MPSMEFLYAASETMQPLLCQLSPLIESLNFSICYDVLDAECTQSFSPAANPTKWVLNVALFYTERHEGLG